MVKQRHAQIVQVVGHVRDHVARRCSVEFLFHPQDTVGFPVKGHVTCQRLVQDDTQGVPIGRLAYLTKGLLWGHVGRRAHHVVQGFVGVRLAV